MYGGVLMGSVRSIKKNQKNQPNTPANAAGARRRLKIWATCIVLFLAWAGYTYYVQAEEISGKSQQLSETKASLDETQQKLEQLKYEISRLQDPEYIGQIAMKKYGLYKPGELPVRIPSNESQK